jgi:hypothetical protein
MSAPWVPPRRGYHLRILALSLTVLVVGLTAFLMGVRMEAVIPATGTITARDLQDIRTLHAGLIEPGWCEGEASEHAQVYRVRLDAQGNGLIDPACGGGTVTQHVAIAGGRRVQVPLDNLRFHRLQAGDELWPGQVLAALHTDAWRAQLHQLELRLREWQSNGDGERLRGEADVLRRQLGEAVLRVPDSGQLWQVVQVRVAPAQAVLPGDIVARIVPLDPETRQPCDLIARLEIEEKHCADLTPGQLVRLASQVYDHRLHGHAQAWIERIEPWGEPGTDGVCRYMAIAPITDAKFPLPLGSTVKANVIVGRKVVYRIILEH